MVSGNNLKFSRRISGNSKYYAKYPFDYPSKVSYFDGEKFTAPVTGRYRIGLHLTISGGEGPYHYLIDMKRSGPSSPVGYNMYPIHQINASGTRHSRWNNDGRHFSTEVDLQKNENIYFDIQGDSSGIAYNNRSFMEGRLIQVQ